MWSEKYCGPWHKAKSHIYGGHSYQSKFEAGYAMELDVLKKAGEIKDWLPHINIPLSVNGEIITRYTIDFVVHHNDGTVEYVETKGYDGDAYARLRWKLFQAIMKNDDVGCKCTKIKQATGWKKGRFKYGKH